MPTASSPTDCISALVNGEFLKAERLLSSILVPALSETNIPTSHAFLQSPLQTFNCRMIQGTLSSQISLYSQRRAVSPRVFQSTAIGCPVLDSMTVSFPNNSASQENHESGWKIAGLLKNRKGSFVCFSKCTHVRFSGCFSPAIMATHLLRDRAPCVLLVPDSGPPIVKKVIYKGRKTQKTADGDVFLLSWRLFTWQLGRLSAGLAVKPWGHGNNGQGPLVWSPSGCKEQRPWGWDYLGPCPQSW